MIRLLAFFLVSTLSVCAAEPTLREKISTLFRERKWEEAQLLLEKAVASEPTNAEAHYFLGVSFLNRNEPEHAWPVLEKAVALDPTNSRYYRHLGDAYGMSAQKAGLFSKMGWAKKCSAAYNKAVELDPKDIDARWSVMEYARQAPGFLGGGMDQAYLQAAAIKQINVGAGRVAFAILYVSEKKYAEAFAQFDEALQLNPDDYEVHFQIGKLAETTGQSLERGLTALRRCLALPVPPKSADHIAVHWRIGNILAKQGDKAAARAAYEAALALDPKFSQATEALVNLEKKS